MNRVISVINKRYVSISIDIEITREFKIPLEYFRNTYIPVNTTDEVKVSWFELGDFSDPINKEDIFKTNKEHGYWLSFYISDEEFHTYLVDEKSRGTLLKDLIKDTDEMIAINHKWIENNLGKNIPKKQSELIIKLVGTRCFIEYE